MTEDELAAVKQRIMDEVRACTTLEELAACRRKWLGKKGIITLLLRGLRP